MADFAAKLLRGVFGSWLGRQMEGGADPDIMGDLAW